MAKCIHAPLQIMDCAQNEKGRIASVRSKIVEIENLLRKIIYRFMIKTAGSDWFFSTVPNEFRESVSKTAEKNKINIDTTDQLYYADFIQLVTFLFAAYTMKPRSDNFFIELKDIILSETNDNEKIEKIKPLLEMYEAKSNWDRFFSDKIAVSDLSEKWNKLYGYRNQVAHAKRITKDEYNMANSIISELKPAFESCLEQIDDVHLTDEQKEAVQAVAKETVVPAKRTTKSSGPITISMPEWTMKSQDIPLILSHERPGDSNWLLAMDKPIFPEFLSASRFVSPSLLETSDPSSSTISITPDPLAPSGRIEISPTFSSLIRNEEEQKKYTLLTGDILKKETLSKSTISTTGEKEPSVEIQKDK